MTGEAKRTQVGDGLDTGKVFHVDTVPYISISHTRTYGVKAKRATITILQRPSYPSFRKGSSSLKKCKKEPDRDLKGADKNILELSDGGSIVRCQLRATVEEGDEGLVA